MSCVGTDIIEITRIEKAVNRWGERFLCRVFTDAELGLYRQKPQSLAVRFAGKEAVMKALGTGNSGIGWREIEILPDPGGQPSVHLHGKAQTQATHLGLNRLAISLSHSREYAIAVVTGNTR